MFPVVWRLTIDSDPFSGIYVLGQCDNRLEASLYECRSEKGIAQVQRLSCGSKSSLRITDLLLLSSVLRREVGRR